MTNTTKELQQFELDMEKAKGILEAYRDVALNRVKINQSIVTNYTFGDCGDFESGVQFGVFAYLAISKTNKEITLSKIQAQAKSDLTDVKIKLGQK